MSDKFKSNSFSKLLVKWFEKNQRDLPWRLNQTAYRVWISEIMLQQTRVEAVINYFNQWMEKWPDIESLSLASEDDVLNYWKGLGYYSRAKNILKTAKIVVSEFKGDFPHELSALLKLPGIGRYTAGAIGSIAFQKKISLVDGNVARVYSRIFLSKQVVNTPKGLSFYYKIADDLLPEENLRSFNQGLMELGATVCTPKNPDCQSCPVAKFCEAFKCSAQKDYPIRLSKGKAEQLYKLVFVAIKKGQYFISQQNLKGRYQGLWQFPGVMLDQFDGSSSEYENRAVELFGSQGKLGPMICEFSHSFTRYKQTLQVYPFTPDDKSIQLDGSWFSLKAMHELPMGSAQVKILRHLVKG